MRVLLIAIGSTGDVQPMALLGKELRRRGHDVSLAAFDTLRPLVEAAGLTHVTLPGDAQTYIGSIIRPGANPATYLRRFEGALQDVADELLLAIYEAARNADAVVSGFFGSFLYAVTDGLDIPLFQANYCLTDRTGAHCLPVMQQPPLGAGFNRMTYSVAYRMIGKLEERCVLPVCRRLGLPEYTTRNGPPYWEGPRVTPVLYALSEHVVPRPPEWPDNIRLVGFWGETPEAYAPSEALGAFLGHPDPAVYIGFGSMTSGDMEKALRAVLDAVSQSGVRAVLSCGWSGLDARQSLPENVYVLQEYLPHHWLFDHVQAIVHHAGAGTTAAGLRAGKPTLAIPFGSDQFFWGDRIHALGCGPRPLPRTKLASRRLARSLQDLTQTPEYSRNCLAIQEKLRSEDGAANAADIIEAETRGGM